MLVEFFYELRAGGIAASITEFLTLLEAMEQQVDGFSADDFYYLSRSALVKDERHYDRFDRVFASYFRGVQGRFAAVVGDVPEERQACLRIRFIAGGQKNIIYHVQF